MYNTIQEAKTEVLIYKLYVVNAELADLRFSFPNENIETQFFFARSFAYDILDITQMLCNCCAINLMANARNS